MAGEDLAEGHRCASEVVSPNASLREVSSGCSFFFDLFVSFLSRAKTKSSEML
jgi:hypothetical protein